LSKNTPGTLGVKPFLKVFKKFTCVAVLDN
jgi:hypothetical protein